MAPAGRYAKRQAEAGHCHRTGDDSGRPRAFTDAETLIADFFAEIERILTERGVSIDVVKDETRSRGAKP